MQINWDKVLIKGISKLDIRQLAFAVAQDDTQFMHLVKIIQAAERTPAMKAAWIIGTMAELKQTELIHTYQQELIDLVMSQSSGSVVRELMKAINTVTLNEEQEGRYLQFCFDQLMRMDVDVAVKYCANRYLEKAVKKYPELKSEFISLLKAQLEVYNDAWHKYTQRIIHRLEKKKSKTSAA